MREAAFKPEFPAFWRLQAIGPRASGLSKRERRWWSLAQPQWQGWLHLSGAPKDLDLWKGESWAQLANRSLFCLRVISEYWRGSMYFYTHWVRALDVVPSWYLYFVWKPLKPQEAICVHVTKWQSGAGKLIVPTGFRHSTRRWSSESCAWRTAQMALQGSKPLGTRWKGSSHIIIVQLKKICWSEAYLWEFFFLVLGCFGHVFLISVYRFLCCSGFSASLFSACPCFSDLMFLRLFASVFLHFSASLLFRFSASPLFCFSTSLLLHCSASLLVAFHFFSAFSCFCVFSLLELKPTLKPTRNKP